MLIDTLVIDTDRFNLIDSLWSLIPWSLIPWSLIPSGVLGTDPGVFFVFTTALEQGRRKLLTNENTVNIYDPMKTQLQIIVCL